MVDIFYDDGTPVPNPNMVNKNSPPNLSFHVDRKLLKLLDKNVNHRIHKGDKDYVMLMDGYEGAGKSTLAQQIGTYVDPTLDMSRICMTAEEFKQAILKSEKGQCVIYDEAVTGLSAGESITRVGRLLKSLMMQMRQKNLFVIIILPSVFEFNKYAILNRARSFIHVYEIKDKMGFWVGYNRKDLRNLYIKGKKTYSYKVRSRFNGRFYGKYTVSDAEYRKKKSEALEMLDDSSGKTGESKFSWERKMYAANLSLALKKFLKMSQPEFCKHFKALGIDMTRENLNYMICEARKDKMVLEIVEKPVEKWVKPTAD